MLNELIQEGMMVQHTRDIRVLGSHVQSPLEVTFLLNLFILLSISNTKMPTLPTFYN